MKKAGKEKLSPAARTGLLSNLTHKLKLSTGLISSAGIIMAAVLYSIDFSWVSVGKSYQLKGTVVRDLNKNGIMEAEDLPMSNVNLRVYSDLNKNGSIDPYDLYLGQSFSGIQGDFSFELPEINTFNIRPRVFGKYGSWDTNNSFSLTFDNTELQHIRKIKSIWLEVYPQEDNADFAITEISLKGEKKKLRWNHQPWKMGKHFQSPDMKKLLKPLLNSRKQADVFQLEFKFLEGISPRKIKADVYLHIKFENTDTPYLLAFENGLDKKGNPIHAVSCLNNQAHENLLLSYTGKPSQCLLQNKQGQLILFNRNTEVGVSLNSQLGTDSYPLIADPQTASWWRIEGPYLQWLNSRTDLIKEEKLRLPFCPDQGSCLKAYAYHALADEIWMWDKNDKLWKLPLSREGEAVSVTDLRFVADWKEKARSFPGEIYRMAIDTRKDEIYFLTQDKGKLTSLNKIKMDGSSYRPLGPILDAGKALKHITGFEIRPEGDIWIMNNQIEEGSHDIFKIDPDYQLMSLISKQKIQGGARNCSCMAVAPYKISTRVYDDKNLNEKLDADERYLHKVGLKVRSHNTKENEVLSIYPNEKGDYIYRTYEKGMTEFQIDEESLPEGFVSSSYSSIIVSHKTTLSGADYFPANFAVSHISNSPNIRWAGIRGKLSEGGVQLEWATSKEVNAKVFEVLRSEDGIHYESIGGVEPKGSHEDMQEYEYKDYLIDEVETSILAYRIKMKGGMGKSAYSPVTKIVVGQEDEGLDLDVRVHPSNESIKLSYQVLKPGPSEIRILNLTGNVMQTIPVQLSRNGAEENVEVKGWAKGMYYAQLRNGKNSVMRRWVLK
ncbi:MAG: T9SS type A sorting domain-containing protein [Bacteroidia bacterium]|nr:T9SS type A sorting domain-containing protein [Bacteroidia bacterium]